MKKFLSAITVISIILLSLTSCKNTSEGKTDDITKPDTEIMSEITVPSEIDVDSMDLEFTDNDSKESYSETSVTSISQSEDIVSITKDGVYKITGKHSQIKVSAPETAKPQIILENAEIANKNGPAIYIEQADKVFITVAENSKTVLSDSASYDSTYDNADGVIFSKSDLTVNGKGSLDITANYKCGIVSKDDLNILNTSIEIKSKGTAIEGKDCVKISGANITVNSETDGIKSTNNEDGSRGYVLIDSGNFNITAVNDAVQAETALFINGGSFKLSTGGGSQNSSNSQGGMDRWGMWGNSSSSTDTASAKALKAVSLIKITDGSFTIDSSDDAIHSNSDLEISGGTFNIASGDDGIHADDQLIISNGEISISKSYEGIEATAVTVSGGKIDLIASDDGFNAAGGNDASSISGRPGQNPFESDSKAQINFTGGYILVNASGDGIDSNGSITLSGGVLLVSGPENSGNGSLDYGLSATVTGGIAVITGSSGMATTFGSSSTQPSFMYNVSSASKGTAVALSDGDKVIASFTPAKGYSNIIISCPDMKVGSKYTLNIGGTVSGSDKNGYSDNGKIISPNETYEIEITSVSTSNGGMGGNVGGGMHGGGKPGGGMMRPGGRY